MGRAGFPGFVTEASLGGIGSDVVVSGLSYVCSALQGFLGRLGCNGFRVVEGLCLAASSMEMRDPNCLSLGVWCPGIGS